MSSASVRPTTLEGIKRLAKLLSKEQGVPHSSGLDLASHQAGFANYQNARRNLRSSASHRDSRRQEPAVSSFPVYINVFWKDSKTKETGTEIIEVPLSKPLDDIIESRYYKKVRGLSRFKRWASDHILCQVTIDGQSSAIAEACKAARALQFMMATGLKPSPKSLPMSDYGRNKLPGRDHPSSWYDPISKKYIGVDEPYAASVEEKKTERAAWATRLGQEIVKPEWAGMYYPEGGSELYLISDKEKGLSAELVAAALATLDAPIVPENCKSVEVKDGDYFRSPGEISAQTKATRPKGEKKQRASATTVPYQMFMASGRRPSVRMASEKHAELGQLLKDVLSATYERKGVYKRIDKVRCELDDWVQAEYTSEELSDQVFFDLYYHERHEVPDNEQGKKGREVHTERLRKVQAILRKEYPDCEPVRTLVRKLDLAIKSLTIWN
ncbi:DUF5623 domain-containing protein [Neorhizobium alkalisoli]|uniref:DUF5623 domain-containing protein n=1 Tax=Neorhizobium alkalisoli TaxID=528178 RepID=UPI00131A1271|nr:DUF5623 domain-containing protein [Neorhizobium alkalisoli]